jgi:hypothetical protein
MVNMSFSRSDSAQYLNVEPPGIVLEVIGRVFNGFWVSRGVQVTMEVRMLVRVRR